MDYDDTSFRMVARSYGKHYTAGALWQMSGFSKVGGSLLAISDTAEKIGIRTRGIKITIEQLNEVSLPAILHWDRNHFVVLKNNNGKIIIADPGEGIVSYKIVGVYDNFNLFQKKEICHTPR